MLYGFIVAAFLIINMDGRKQMIPFATYNDCKVAEQFYRDAWRLNEDTENRMFHCVNTGSFK